MIDPEVNYVKSCDSTVDTPVGDFGPQDAARLREWNRSLPPPVNSCVHTQISRQCHEAPDSTAIDAWDGTMTYAELERVSSAFAAHLIQIGVGREIIVPLWFDKSRWVVVAMLGVIKAGGAFVLLDASLPLKRIQFIVGEVNASIIVASTQYTARAAELVPQVVVLNDRLFDPTKLSGNDESLNSLPLASPSNAVYVMFTSGSTGQPKGVVIEHSAFTTNSMAYAKSLALTSHCRVLQFASYTFDACMIEIMSTLMVGGCVCIPSNEDRMSRLGEVIADLRVDWLLLTPSVARLLNPAGIPTVRRLVLGGEPLTQSDIEKWKGHVDLFNAYGPTECAAVSTTQAASTLADPQYLSTCLGQGTACITWVTNPNNHEQLMPIGAVGELLIEGPNVGRGYLNGSNRTASAFIDPPQWRQGFLQGTTSGRFYKTGDLVQYATTDGSLKYVGRKDTQVKLAGQRLELGEVEHHIRKYFPRARHVMAAVVPRKDGSDSHREILVVFIDHPEESDEILSPLSPGSALASLASLQAFRQRVLDAISQLRESLPEYMVPSRFIPLSRTPLLPSGKADLQQLRKEAQSLSLDQMNLYGISNREATCSPKSMEEQKLQKIWAEVLEIPADQIGLHDDFFQLGGNSLDAMRMVARARMEGMPGLTVSVVFMFPALSALAKRADARLGERRQDEGYALSAKLDETSHLDLSSLDTTTIVNNGFNPESIVGVYPTTDFQRVYIEPGLKSYFLWRTRSSEPVEPARLTRALQLLVNKHSILRTIFLPHQDGFVHVILDHVDIQLAHHSAGDQQLLDDVCRALCQEDNDALFPIGRPYIQATLVESGVSEEYALIVRLSHAQWDVETLQLFFQQLTDAYNGKSVSPPTLDFPTYMQYRLAQRTTEAYTFWQRYLQDSTITDWTRLGTADGNQNRTLVIAFGAASLPLAQPRGKTMATLVRASWALTLARLTQETDLMFGHTVNGRSLPILGINQTMGCCLNTAPIRVIIQPSWTAQDLLEHVHAQYVRTIDYETLDFSDIVSNCTSWPEQTHFSSVVTHDHLDTVPTIGLDNRPAELQPVHVRVAEDTFRRMTWPVQVMTAAQGSKVTVTILASSHMLSQNRANWLMGKLTEAMVELARIDSMELLNLAPYDDL
ncbi:uncharacterized protein BDW43DRAFT_280198 [Aspergillus alliaceus]|uniref:uncharacterized protein n=1 Tax=Petromyces alliaceus TaxID=209559 RepID=UPI0012A6CC94|nr:uncharacterized protein BDW43DRAFT_280198 [Aspergillus alliaceus]KAB8232042.1 hypothetical protein BDW43DRAFT_280198 [Aspergillus alliaceus]